MSIASIKLDLAKKIIDTDDKELIGYIKAIFEGQSENWFEDLPADVQTSFEKALAQSEKGEGRNHTEVMKKYAKWLK